MVFKFQINFSLSPFTKKSIPKFVFNFSFSLLLLVFVPNVTNAECLEYEEIEGGPCNCWPTGWNGITGAEEICNISQYQNGYGCTYNVDNVSPSGGNFAGLHVFPSITEGIERTWTGLNTGSEYTFVMWWHSVELNCAGTIFTCCADLWVVVDGVDYFYTAVDDWTLLELCIEAESDEITIEIKGILNGGTDGYILLDDANCGDAEIECCELSVDLNNEETICPNEDLFLEGFYSGENGSVNIEWTSDPPDGVTYLDNLDSTDPVFNFPTTDNTFEGATYILNMNVEDDLCSFSKNVEVIVLPYPEFTFEFEDNPICSDLQEYVLPTTSLEDISGTWNVENFFPTDVPGQELVFSFTPDSGETACPNTSEHIIEVMEFISPTFDFQLEYCREPGGIIELPEQSNEGIEGTWNILLIEMDLYPDGIIDLYFTPNDLFCTMAVDWDIEILGGEEPTFTITNQLCLQDNILEFPTISNEGIEGTWDISEIDPSQYSDFVVNTFTPISNGGDDCFGTYEHVVEILDVLAPQFNIPLNLCSTEAPIVLETMSLEGYEGAWSIPVIDPATSPATVSVIWEPTGGQSPCVIQTELIIQINQASIPEFVLPDQICQNENNFQFPTTSINGITGTWSIPYINPSMISGTVTSIFLPQSGFCTETIEAEIEITEGMIPLFSIDENICASDDIITLPILSNNGIGGTWNLPTIDPSNYGGQGIEVTFSPNDQNLCASDIVVNLEIEAELAPTFDLPSILCWQDEDLVFQDTSNNNIIGTWDTGSLDVSLIAGGSFTNNFVPNPAFCASTLEANIVVTAPYNIGVINTNPTSCTEENGSIEAEGDISDKLFSIDGGITWQAGPIFDNLAGGFYQMMVASTALPDCILSFDVSLETPNAPNIQMIESENISSCNLEDGQIMIEALGTDLEYSIDSGNTWQSDPSFTNLSAASYNILVRTNGSMDCIISGFAVIEGFPETEIINFNYSDITDCGLEDGSISIEAIGNELEYSIDNGSTWNNSGLFDNLPAGSYEIIVQSTLDPACKEMRTQLLVAPGMPTIDLIAGINPSSCNLDTGQITLEASGDNLEFSIDGLNWQMSPIFDNLNAGEYEIYVRDADQTNCFDSRIFELIEEQENLTPLDFLALHPTECDLSDGSIEFLIGTEGLEFSIDQENTWQESPFFEMMPAGNYSISIRKIGTTDCTTTIEIELINPECPCEDLNVEYTLDVPDCYSENNQGASIQLTSISGNVDPSYTLNWDNGSLTEEISELESGSYSVTITYDEVCEWIESFDIELNSEINFELTSIDPDCEDISNGEIVVSNSNGGSGNLQYSIDGVNFQDEVIFDELSEGSYTVSVLDELGCIVTQNISLNNGSTIESFLETSIAIIAGDTVSLDPVIDLSQLDDYSWLPDETIIDVVDEIAIVNPTETTEYFFTYQSGACSYERSIVVEVIRLTQLYIPNIFSPNGDGDNDYFYIQSQSDVSIESMSIYNRWGELMFEKINPKSNVEIEGWDGRFKGQKVLGGVYVYTISYESNGETIIESGTITLLD